MPLKDIIDRLMPKSLKEDNDESMLPLKDESAKVTRIYNEYERAFTYHRDNYEREEENQRYYSGIGDEAWPTKAIKKLKSEDRITASFNLIRGKVDSLAGMIEKNILDIDFIPTEGAYSDLTRIIKELFNSDKELMDWDIDDLECLIDGLVYRGVEQMVIDTRFNDIGNVKFERVLPGLVTTDPDWVSNNSADMRRLWKVAYLTADEIKIKYDLTDEDIARAQSSRRHGSEFDTGSKDKGIRYFNQNSTYGDKYKVIEFHHMERLPRTIEVDPITLTRIPEGTEEEKREFAIKNRLDLSAGVIEYKTTVNEYYVTTIIPDLLPNETVEDRKSEIQIGRLPFFIWSCGRSNGKDSGIVDLLKDAQNMVNKRETLINEMIAASANGALIIDPDLFDNDNARIQDFLKNINNPSYKGVSAPGAISSGRNHTLVPEKPPFPGEIVQELGRMIEYMDKISTQTPTLDGRNESSHDTGILFARRQLQAEVTQAVLMKRRMNYWNQKAEAYIMLAKDHYSGMYREFVHPMNITKKTEVGEDKEMVPNIEVNVPVITPEGETVKNDISTLPRHKVVVTQSIQGPTQRATDRAVAVDLLRVVPPDHAVSRAQLTKQVLRSIDFKDQDKQFIDEASELESQLAVESMRTQIANMRAQRMQLEQAQQAQQQTQRQPVAQPPQQPNNIQIPLQ